MEIKGSAPQVPLRRIRGGAARFLSSAPRLADPSAFSRNFLAAGHAPDASDLASIFSDESNSPAPVRAHIALIGTFAPRKCGIATFTADIFEKLGEFHPEIAVDVYALTNSAEALDYRGVAGEIVQESEEDYHLAARRINESGVGAVWLQHEYGIFGGDCGEMVIDFVDRIAAPLILTLHTVLEKPSEKQRAILDHLLSRASRVMVMSRHSQHLLLERYGVEAERIVRIEHGAPDRPFGRQAQFKRALGLEGRRVLMSFGLLNPGKGLESVIEALPAITRRHPDVIYRIVGATHPNLVVQQGEAYRERLQALAERLGVADHIAWDNRFLETETLLDQLEACDIYVTAYPNLEQSTSGTLSYAVALGKAVVSTPYLHACELLADGVGELIEPKSSEAIAEAVLALLDHEDRLTAMQQRAYARGRTMIWPRFAGATAEFIRSVTVDHATSKRPLLATPGLIGLTAMSDGTGMLQHAIGIIPDRNHGYCLDDNARALMLVNIADAMQADEAAYWSSVYASFIQHCWNPEVRRFRNFMHFDRRWCEDAGSEDSNGRALWALGHSFAHGRTDDLRHWALRWFDTALPAFNDIDSPRALAFAMLGSCEVVAKRPGHDGANALIKRGAELLHQLLAEARRPDWAWFEAVLGYDNPRLSQALIEAGLALGNEQWLRSGLSSLAWIARQQIAATGNFRPIGSESFHRPYDYLPFDQQPLEALAAIEAAASAHRATGEATWLSHAQAAYRWFFGGNDRGVMLADIATGRCRDGVTPRGANENCGAESILAFQLSHYAVLALARSQPRDSTGDFIEPGQRIRREPSSHR